LESLQIALHAYDKKNYTEAENWLNITLNGYKNLSLQEKDLYEVLSPVSESQVEDLYTKVRKIKNE